MPIHFHIEQSRANVLCVSEKEPLYVWKSERDVPASLPGDVNIQAPELDLLFVTICASLV